MGIKECVLHPSRRCQTNIRLWMYTPNGTVWYFVYFGQVLAVSGLKTTVPRLFFEHLLQNENKHQIMNVHTEWNWLILSLFWSSISCFRLHMLHVSTHFQTITNIRSWMYTLKGTVWYTFCLIWSSISCFRLEIVQLKVTTVTYTLLRAFQ